MIPSYYDYSTYLKNFFEGRVQKISINAGFSCPNRDGKISYGGCTYCNNSTFSPAYCNSHKSVRSQVEEGIGFFAHKYANMDYLAYFQSFTNTYSTLDRLKSIYEEALSDYRIKGLVIGTRPDCVDDELLDYLSFLAKNHYVMVEYGVESTLDTTLSRINRGHSYDVSKEAIIKTANLGIQTSAHLILGLPGETKEDVLNHAIKISELPLNTLKLHQLQIISGTKMAIEYDNNPESFNLYSIEEYIDILSDFIPRVRKGIALERFVSQSPADMLIAPKWGLKNHEFKDKLDKVLTTRNITQGDYYKKEKDAY